MKNISRKLLHNISNFSNTTHKYINNRMFSTSSTVNSLKTILMNISSATNTESTNTANTTNTNKSFSSLQTELQSINPKINLSKESEDEFYEDKLYFFQCDFSKLQKDKLKKHQAFVCAELTNHQKYEVNILVDIISHFNSTEKSYYNHVFNNLVLINANNDEKSLFNCAANNTNKKKSNNYEDFLFKPEEMFNPNIQIINTYTDSLRPFLASGYFAGKQAVENIDNIKEVKEEAKEEVKKLNPIVSIKLLEFETGKKIVLIKEVRGLLSLGLKEAKEIVESPNVILISKIKREEAEVIKAKLEGIGAKIELV